MAPLMALSRAIAVAAGQARLGGGQDASGWNREPVLAEVMGLLAAAVGGQAECRGYLGEARLPSVKGTRMLPLSDGLPARRFPVVNVLLIVACFAVWLFYELPDLNTAIFHASFYPCTIDNACHGPEPWGVSWITAMFLHGGWDHILGNMLFLAIFGKNVEDALGSLRYLVFYFAGGFVAMLTQTAMTLLFGSASDARVPELGASGAI